MRRLAVAALYVTLAMIGTSACAQANYPQRPIHLIVPFGPGGASDFTARIIGHALSDELKQTIIVVNKPGAAGNIGMDAAAKSSPDGYTLFLGNVGAIAINPSLFGDVLAVKPEEDFVAVTKVVDVPDILVVHPGVPVATVKEFVDYATKRKGQLNFASPGSGSQNRLEMEYLMRETKIEMTHVPYKGGAGPAMTDLVGGQTQVMFTTLPSAMGFIKAGRVRPLGLTTANRLEDLPSIPTLTEEGYPTMVSSSWQGIFVPRGTPVPIVNKLFATLTKVMAQKEVQSQLKTGGVIAATSVSPAEFSAFQKSETQRWGKVIRENHITLN